MHDNGPINYTPIDFEPIYAAVVMLYQDDKVLLVKQKESPKQRHIPGRHTFPGGEIEPFDENGKILDRGYRDTAVREFKEETGLDIKRESMRRLKCYDLFIEMKSGYKRVIVNLFFCDECEGKLSEGPDTDPTWAKIEDFIYSVEEKQGKRKEAGKYPLPYVSGSFYDYVVRFLQNK